MATWLYHSTEKPRVFQTAGDVEAALADGWADTPAAFDGDAPKDEPKIDGRKRRKQAQAADE